MENKTNLDRIKKELQSQRHTSSDVISMAEYKDHKHQRVSVCRHVPGHIGRYHTHDFFEINYVQRGKCINLVEDDYVLMGEGDVIIMHPGAFHDLYAEEDAVVYNILIDEHWLLSALASMLPQGGAVFAFLNEAGHENFYKYVVCTNAKEDGSWTDAATKLIGYSQSGSAWRYLLLESTALELLGRLCEAPHSATLSCGRGKSSHIMIDMLSYIAENCATVDLDSMAERYFYSKTHICRLFLKNTGKSFNRTLMDMKIGRACSMLESTEMTAEDIARALGYDSVEYFYRLFKKKVGLTPKAYKNKNKC